MHLPAEPRQFKLVVVSAGTSDPSATRLLADRTAERATALAAEHGHAVTVSVIDLREIAADISTALVSQLITPRLQKAVTALGAADGVIAAAPVYKAARAACSPRSSRFWTPTCSSPSPSCSPPPPGPPGTPSSPTIRSGRCSRTCAP